MDLSLPPSSPSSFWTGAHDDELRAGVLDNMSYSLIAAVKFGNAVSRNAVIGRAYRLGLSQPGGKPIRKPRDKEKPRERSTAPRAPRRRMGGVRSIFDGVPGVPELPPDTSEFAVSFLTSTDKHCKYLLTETPDIRDQQCCGAPVYGEHSWCKRHCRIVYQPHADPTQEKHERTQRRHASSFNSAYRAA